VLGQIEGMLQDVYVRMDIMKVVEFVRNALINVGLVLDRTFSVHHVKEETVKI
jgi:hypothetical protein